MARPIQTLLIDNYDSFTFNLFQLIAEVNGVEPVVIRNDGATWSELAEVEFANVVISPGPGRPDRPSDFGICAQAIAAARVPLLGVCLGHQGLGYVSGGAVIHAPEVMHGRLSAVYHDGKELFEGIPQGFDVVRYHSLCVASPAPPDLEVTAWTADGVIMGLRHRRRPRWGVQFHPESISTTYGHRLLENFRDLTERSAPPASPRRRPRPASIVPERSLEPHPSRDDSLELKVRRLDRLYDPERAFVHLYANDDHAFWLDSSKLPDPHSRYSFMGGSSGPLGALVHYDVESRQVTVTRGGATETHRESIFDYLERELARMSVNESDLPFDFDCGFVGYFGYELKADCGGSAVHASTLPDAAFVLADRLLAFDHLEGRTYLVCLTDRDTREAGERWLDETADALGELPPLAPVDLAGAAGGEGAVGFRLSRSHERYVADIERCKEYLLDGETYEVCLTNKVWADADPDPLTLYRVLRAVNPAPFSALLRLGDAAVACSSPERFLRVGGDRWVEAKPIKGTVRRGRTPDEDRKLAEELAASEKNRAENLMITDLLRNDLGVVCEVGSVHVPHLMAIETYETVHQMVSTVRGRLRSDLAATDCIRACFPGGSMTGAPKKRTMEIIDELEREARGVYSGAIGYLGLSGASDLNIVIRTIVLDGGSASIGMGGAIVMQSDEEEEYQETLLKAEALMRAITLTASRDGAAASRRSDRAHEPGLLSAARAAREGD